MPTAGSTPDLLVDELVVAATATTAEPSWADATLTAIVAHIQRRYHEHLRQELPRLEAMLAQVVSRHGDHLPDVLLPLQRTFLTLQQELLDHMAREDDVLFPFIVALESGRAAAGGDAAAWLEAPVAAMEADHELAGAALQVDATNDERLRAARMGLSDVSWPVLRPGRARDGHAPARPPREPHPVPTRRTTGTLARVTSEGPPGRATADGRSRSPNAPTLMSGRSVNTGRRSPAPSASTSAAG